MTTHAFAALLGVASLTVPVAAQEGPTPLEARADAAFRHAHSGVSLPTTLIGLTRSSGNEYRKPQLDIAFSYGNADKDEEVSVYIYRVPAGAPVVWFDVARQSIEERKGFGTLSAIDAPFAFTPPGGRVASGIRRIWSASGARLKSTALVIVPVGDWLVKIRHSSSRKDAATLARDLEQVIAGIGWPAREEGPTVVAITDCTTPLRADKPARPRRDEATIMAQALALVGIPELERKRAERWCRDRGWPGIRPIYRPGGLDDRYLLAFADNGGGLMVEPWPYGGAKFWRISQPDANETIAFTPQTALPLPDQLAAIVDAGEVSATTTWGDERDIRLFTAKGK